MQIEPPLEEVTLLRRYKRFLADVRSADGTEFTVHCPNTGSMTNCVLGGPQAALISTSRNKKRKYPHTLEALQVAHGHWVGVNTGRANRLVEEAIIEQKIAALNPSDGVERELRFADSRLDLALGERDCPHTYIEVKSVTLGPGLHEPDSGVLQFPDAVTLRGQKHLRTLMQVVDSGRRSVLFFCVQHTGAKVFVPADQVDPHYGQLLRQAANHGVEIVAWRVALSANQFVLDESIAVKL